ncbi:tripartite tricarboxylate transporter substrate-binding protein [Roseomonas sp. NAR14]|uniref:Tripartite tricarboxylate transporter substrate-binding protein n=1 Tax=Roseomonas acroporae TaxID=2937791 RepID=A0A9X2BYH0_9PROT|nr:tripartite tricarboxylate transporter substrate-binding protein [Roseomonas acroporae]MCK8786000.1 tripartite tricarboxylate transporter substrate-binding protein [Roseomonas acroporae]
MPGRGEAAGWRRRAALGAGLALAVVPAPRAARAASWPERPVKVLVPFPPGGTVDILARLIASGLSETLGQAFVCENRPGAGGNIAAAAAARAAPDGYTLLMGSPGTQAINAHLYASPGYDGIADFAPIVLVADVPNILAAHPDLGVRTVPGLVAKARERAAAGSRLAYGETSIGGSTHLSAELFRIQAGIEAEHVSYRGSAPMLQDLLPGRVQFGFDNLPSILPHLRSGALSGLGVTSAARWPGLPDLPAIAESLPGYEVTAWFGLLAPRGTPAALVETANAAARRAMAAPALRARFMEVGAQPVGGTPDDYAARIASEHRRWGVVIRQAGIRME